jgi:hypothetical protein
MPRFAHVLAIGNLPVLDADDLIVERAAKVRADCRSIVSDECDCCVGRVHVSPLDLFL